MPWLALAVVGVVTFLYGKSKCWWSCSGFTCDIESDMPDALKTQVLSQAAGATSAATLQAFAVTLYQAGYIQSAYCLADRAWVLNGSQGTAPIPPTATDIFNAQAQRAAAAQALANPAAAAVAAASQAASAAAANPPAGGGLSPALIPALANALSANVSAASPATAASQAPGLPPPAAVPTATGSVALPVPFPDMEVGSVNLPVPHSDMEVGRVVRDMR
jgi:hypothetical protein